MEAVLAIIDENNLDDPVDAEIAACLNLHSPKSFFLFAGAGSGKTRSLVEALKHLRKNYSRHLRLHGQRIGVITYTNKACDEITHRIDFDPLVEVSTIHSFVWKLIQGFNADIKAWLTINLRDEIFELQALQAKGRGGKAGLDREKSIEAKTRRLKTLSEIKKFDYNPNGDNRGRDSLNHSEVIKIAASFLLNKPTMQRLLIAKFPVLLIDESQDTNKLLMEAFLAVQAANPNRFGLGLFGDTMQRIYADGKIDLDYNNLPPDWAKPAKKMNHRCPKRVVSLINKLRSDVDGNEQIPRTDAADGCVRLFVVNSGVADKTNTERMAAQIMANITGDTSWNTVNAVKTLILEHHMAARRMGFLEMYEPLYRSDSLRIGLLDGTLSGLKLFSERVLPLIEAKKKGDAFAVASVVRKHSPLLSKPVLRAAGKAQINQIQKTREAVEILWSLWADGKIPRFIDILRNIAKTELFEIPESLKPIVARSKEEQEAAEAEIIRRKTVDDGQEETTLDHWDQFLLTSFNQLELYVAYVTENASFDTHQGVKGLEFDRVTVIIDDSEAKGFLFSYDKLFGVKGKTKADLDNENSGKETGIDRTRRLFYVTCSRAEKSLAIVAYSDDPQRVKQHVIKQEWFEESEVEIIL